MGKEKVSESQIKEAFFEEIKKTPNGDILLSIFDDYTSGEVQIFSGYNNRGKRVVASLSLFPSSAMELYHVENYETNLLTLTVFRNKDDCLKEERPDIRFIIKSSKRMGSKPDIEYIDFRSRRFESYNLSALYDRYLIEDIFVGIIQSLMVGRE